MEHPFQEGKELSSDGTGTELITDESSGSQNPARQFFVGVGGEDVEISANEPTAGGETESVTFRRLQKNQDCAFRGRRIRARNLNQDFYTEGVFNSPATIIFADVREMCNNRISLLLSVKWSLVISCSCAMILAAPDRA